MQYALFFLWGYWMHLEWDDFQRIVMYVRYEEINRMDAILFTLRYASIRHLWSCTLSTLRFSVLLSKFFLMKTVLMNQDIGGPQWKKTHCV